ncbi:MAG: hypothetical protein V2A79_15460, partial [Planctomycetota bacterium]
LGKGMTSDGTHVTNGFQPLYVFLMVPVYLLVPPDNLVLPVHIACTLLALAGTAAAGIFYLIALRLFSRTAALCVLFFFTISHYFVATDVNGLETALYGLTLAATLYYYLTRLVGVGSPTDESSAAFQSAIPDPQSSIVNRQSAIARRSPSIGQCVTLGILAGLTVLARVDAVIFVVCVALHFLWRGFFRPSWTLVPSAPAPQGLRPGLPSLVPPGLNSETLDTHKAVGHPGNRQSSIVNPQWLGAVGAAAFLVTLAPWLAVNLVLCKTIIPDSGPAVRFIALQNGWHNVGNLIGYVGPERFPVHDVPWEYYANNVLRYAVQLLSFLPITAHAQGFSPCYLARPADRFPLGRLVAHAPGAFLVLLGLLTVVVLIAPAILGQRRRPVRPGLGAVAFLRFAMVGWIAAYAFYVLCPWFSHRYLYPVLALLTLGSGAVVDVFLDASLGNRRLLRRAVLGLGVAAYAFLFITQAGHYYARDCASEEPDPYTPVLHWVRTHLPADAVIGCFQSGVLSYFLPQRCVNLDGVVNAAALRASREKRLWDYLRRENVGYIVDWPICIERNLRPFAGVEHVPLVALYDEYAMDVYQVTDGP